MNSFTFVKLEDNEKIIFGPVTTRKSISVGSMPNRRMGAVPIDKVAAQQQLTHMSGRTVGVTTQRIIIENLMDSNKTQIIHNDQVRRVFINTEQRKGQISLTLKKVEEMSGKTIKLEIKGLPIQTENTLREIFPQAEIIHGKKGGGSKLFKIVAILAGIAFFLLCILPILVLLVGQLFVN